LGKEIEDKEAAGYYEEPEEEGNRNDEGKSVTTEAMHGIEVQD